MASNLVINVLMLVIFFIMILLVFFFMSKTTMGKDINKDYVKDVYTPLKNEIVQNKEMRFLEKVGANFGIENLLDSIWKNLQYKDYLSILDKAVKRDLQNYYKYVSKYNDLVNKTSEIIKTVEKEFSSDLNQFSEVGSSGLFYVCLLLNSLRFQKLFTESDNDEVFNSFKSTDSQFLENMALVGELFPVMLNRYNELDTNNLTSDFLNLREDLCFDSDRLITNLDLIAKSGSDESHFD